MRTERIRVEVDGRIQRLVVRTDVDGRVTVRIGRKTKRAWRITRLMRTGGK